MRRLIQGGFFFIGIFFLGFVFLTGKRLWAGEQSPASRARVEASGEKSESPAYAAEKKSSDSSFGIGLGFLAAALAFGLGAVGAGIAVGNVGAAAMGTLGERPELFGQTLIFIGLAEGIVIFGFIVAWTILGKL